MMARRLARRYVNWCKLVMFDPGQLAMLPLLGSGGESDVYALDNDRVLRLYKPGVALEYVELRRDFYARLRAARPAFETPCLIDYGRVADRIYTIEQRMGGRDFAAVLPSLTGAARERALVSYLRVAAGIGAIQFPELPYTELLRSDAPIQANTWPSYLGERFERALRFSNADLERDIPDLDWRLDRIRAELATLPAAPEAALVHGDYFPGNVFIDERLEICGVGDFGYTTLIGDARMDLAGALAFLELAQSYHPRDTLFLRGRIANQAGADILPILDIYRRYYAVYFSGCQADDPATYRWCVNVLREI